ncbi:hypothetical protein [Microbacterium sp. NPDC087589]|uniref:hypothetical protein n=1 Tax=Microbacterium sp. NPDC087589 TaxID=3364191 RepID=UPI00381157AD
MIASSKRRAFAPIASFLLIAGALVGCSATEPTDPTPTERFATQADYNAAFEACIAKSGITLPDSKDGGFVLPEGEAAQTALQGCMEELGTPPGQPDDATYERQNAAYIACLREGGIDIADPKPGEPAPFPNDLPAELANKCAAVFEGSGE